MRKLTDRVNLSHAARLPWLLLFLALTALTAALISRYLSAPTNAALRRRYMGETRKVKQRYAP